MTWKDWLDRQGPIVLLTTATTGLRANSDKMVAFNYVRFPGESKLLLHRLQQEEILASEQYHRISTTEVDLSGYDTEEFVDEIQHAVDGALCLSYNPKFQMQFLAATLSDGVMVYDLPLLLKGAEMKLRMDPEDITSVKKTEAFFSSRLGKTPSMKLMCQGRGIAYGEDVLDIPVQYNLSVLQAFYERLGEIPLEVQA